MNNTVLVRVRNIYGNPTIYPSNDVADKLCSLSGKKTFSKQDLRTIEQLGFRVQQIPDLDLVEITL